MKKVLTSVCFILVAAVVPAQNNSLQDSSMIQNRNRLQIGIKGGVNCSSNPGNNARTTILANPEFGPVFGVFLSKRLNTYLGVQAEVLFSQNVFSSQEPINDEMYSLSTHISYIDIPFMLQLKPSENFCLLAGPEYDYILGSYTFLQNPSSGTEQQQYESNTISHSAFGFKIGFDYYFSNFTVGGRLTYSLQNNSASGSSIVPGAIVSGSPGNMLGQLTLGYRF